MILDILLWTGIVAGLAASAAALYGRYRILPKCFTGPATCKLEAGGCSVLFRTPNASLYGVPNSLLGVVFYGAMIAGILWKWPLWILFIGASLALFTSIRLGISLIRNRLECRICWTGHVANLIVWLVLLTRLL